MFLDTGGQSQFINVLPAVNSCAKSLNVQITILLVLALTILVSNCCQYSTSFVVLKCSISCDELNLQIVLLLLRWVNLVHGFS